LNTIVCRAAGQGRIGQLLPIGDGRGRGPCRAGRLSGYPRPPQKPGPGGRQEPLDHRRHGPGAEESAAPQVAGVAGRMDASPRLDHGC